MQLLAATPANTRDRIVSLITSALGQVSHQINYHAMLNTVIDSVENGGGLLDAMKAVLANSAVFTNPLAQAYAQWVFGILNDALHTETPQS